MKTGTSSFCRLVAFRKVAFPIANPCSLLFFQRPACFRLVRAENNPFPDASQRLPLDEAKDVVQTLPIQQAFYQPTWNRRVNDEDAKGIQGIRYPGKHV